MKRKIFRYLAILVCFAAILPPALAQQVQTTQSEAAKFTDVSVKVDYNQPYEKMVKGGHYDWTDVNLCARLFAQQGEGNRLVAITIVHFNRGVKSEEALHVMEERGYRPATFQELLALGQEHPNLQREAPIVALGSVGNVRGQDCVPYLGQGGTRRYLTLGAYDRGWNDYYSFAFIQEGSSL